MKRWISAVVLGMASAATAGTYYVDGSTPYPEATHNVVGTVGGAATTSDDTLVLDTVVGGEGDDDYNGYGVVIVTDPTTGGEGQYRKITDYDVGTNTITVNAVWSANLAADSTYRITVGNNVDGDGSQGAPYAHIKKGLDVAAAGAGPHTIYVMPGTYPEVDTVSSERLICAKASNGPYTFSRWPGQAGTVTVQTGIDAGDCVLYIGSTQDYAFNDISFVAANTYTSGVLYLHSDATGDIGFNRCTFDGRNFAMGTYGVVYGAPGVAVARNVTFTDCTTYLDNTTTGGLYGLLDDGGATVWDGCTFHLSHTARKSLFHKNSNAHTSVTITGCTFINDLYPATANWSSLVQIMFASASGKVFDLIDIHNNTNIDRIVDYDDSSLYTEAKRWRIRDNVSTDIYGDFIWIQHNIRWLEIVDNTVRVDGASAETQTIRLGTLTSNATPLGVVKVVGNAIYDASSGHADSRGIGLDYGVDGAECFANTMRLPKGDGIQVRGSYNLVHHNAIRAPYGLVVAGAAVGNQFSRNTVVTVYDGTATSGGIAWDAETTNYPSANRFFLNIVQAGANTYCVKELDAGEHYGNVLDDNIYWFSGTGSHLCRLAADDDDTLAAMQAKWSTASYGSWNTSEDPAVGNDQGSALGNPLLRNPAAGDFSIPDHSIAAGAASDGGDIGAVQRDRPAHFYRVRRTGVR